MNKELLEALERLKTAPTFMGGTIEYQTCTKSETLLLQDYDTIKQALLNAEKDEIIILGIEDYLNRRIKVEPLEDARKAFIEIRNQLHVVKEVLE